VAAVTGRLAKYLATYLALLREITRGLFPSALSKTGHIEEIRKLFGRAVSTAGLDPRLITPHVMRHTTISHAVQAGVDLLTVKKISGHKSLAMVQRYAHANAAHVQASMDKLPDTVFPRTITPDLHQPKGPAAQVPDKPSPCVRSDT
jgi:site-specific recombinase XerD